jgi:hypothetical protein
VIVEHLKGYLEIDDVRVITGNTPYNRYLEAARANHDVIYTQDDDCITDIGPVLAGYDPGLICNAMTPEHAREYPRAQTLLGFGSVWNRSLIAALDGWEHDSLFLREADRVFATLNPHRTVFPRIRLLPHAYVDNRMYRQPDHITCRDAINLRIRQRTGIIA